MDLHILNYVPKLFLPSILFIESRPIFGKIHANVEGNKKIL